MVRWPWNQVEDRLNDKITELESEVEDLRQLVMETAQTTTDLTDKEKELVALFIQEPIWRTKEEIAQEMDLSKSYVSNLLASAREEVEFKDRTINDNGTKSFKLKQEARQELLG
jgi:DNA-binding CsgD family transcriptional regulator